MVDPSIERKCVLNFSVLVLHLHSFTSDASTEGEAMQHLSYVYVYCLQYTAVEILELTKFKSTSRFCPFFYTQRKGKMNCSKKLT